MSDNDSGSSSSKELVPRPSAKLRTVQAKTALSRRGESHQAVTVPFMLNAVRRWWKVAVPIGLLLVGVGGWYVYWSFVPVYQANTLLRIGPTQSILYPSREDSRSAQSFAATQMEQMRHPLVLESVARAMISGQLGQSDGQVEESELAQSLSKRLVFEQLGQSELFELSFQHPDPGVAADIVNTVVQTYLNLRAETLRKHQTKVDGLLQGYRDTWFDKIGELRGIVSQLSADAAAIEARLASAGRGIAGVNTLLAPVRSTRLAELENSLSTAEGERVVLNARIEAAEELAASDLIEVPDWRIEREIEANQEVAALEAALWDGRARLRDLEARLVSPDKNADYVALREKIGQLEEELSQLREELTERVKVELEDGLSATFGSDLAQMRSQLIWQDKVIEVLKDEIEPLKDEYAKEQEKSNEELSNRTMAGQPGVDLSELTSLASTRGNLAAKESELSHAEGVYDRITERMRQLEIESNADDRVACLRPAEPPTTPVESLPWKIIAIVSLIGLCLPFGLAIVWERVVQRVNNPQDLEQDPNLSVLAEITRLPARVRRSDAFASNGNGRPAKVFEESVNNLAASLTLSEDLRSARTLAVTSAAKHEGKTSLAVALPASIARACGKPVLLIDGDMRSPDVHNVFGIPLEPGLVGVLRGKCSLQDAIVTKGTNSVHVLPAGKLRANPLSLLTSEALKSLLDEALDSYHCIIIDTPPILAAAEALVLAKAVDACLMCAMRDVSRVDQVRRACERLATVGVQPIGAVFNGVPARRYAYRYGTYDYANG